MENQKYEVNKTIILDCGYDGMIEHRPCKILALFEANNLWDSNKKDLCAKVRILGTDEVFTTTL
jgi:hypothetical protein